MQQDCTISLERNAMSEGGIRWMYFDAFSSKSSDRNILINTYEQGCSIAFWCRSFTGKEKDAETGYGYFGARYMDHELMTMWLSVDPLADKYPQISSYNYCMWNPVKLVDLDGRDTTFNNNLTRTLFNSVLSKINQRIEEYEKMDPIDFSEEDFDIIADLCEMKAMFDKITSPNTPLFIYAFRKKNGETIPYLDEQGNQHVAVRTSQDEGCLIHESKHIFQTIIGHVTPSGDGWKNYDYQDEYEAYQMQDNYNYIFHDIPKRTHDEIQSWIKDNYSEKDYIIKDFVQHR